jgi:hypothetical protein
MTASIYQADSQRFSRFDAADLNDLFMHFGGHIPVATLKFAPGDAASRAVVHDLNGHLRPRAAERRRNEANSIEM